jgi:outer membrane lipoprotein-sorting protein
MTKFKPGIWVLIWMGFVMASALVSGCAMSTKTVGKPAGVPVPVKIATKAELIEQYNQLAESITSLNAGVTVQLTAGSTYTGTIEQYHEISGFILAQKPSTIRLIGQVPVVGKNIFDMESDGGTFHIFIPSKNQFLVGPANLERPSSKPIENLRPQHLLDAIFWQAIPKNAPTLIEETTALASNFYVLTLVEANGATDGKGSGSMDWEIARKIWFDRKDLSIARIDTFEPGGKPASIVKYAGWELFGTVQYPRQILLDRPQNDYQLQIAITKLTVNEPITPDRFDLVQPTGTELVRVGEGPEEQKP